jgi:hypothetical protein
MRLLNDYAKDKRECKDKSADNRQLEDCLVSSATRSIDLAGSAQSSAEARAAGLNQNEYRHEYY